eukprot:TRINITY_DN4529_c0_g1_i1.p2 TRINITY_DN4529_c0_g1~~TRINITY_DN4529_c0_g1_i1.p2  ORF type:complete len:133 (-),score=29.12 TRINITY_DN4529_c0_g1_i1:10-408(-)
MEQKFEYPKDNLLWEEHSILLEFVESISKTSLIFWNDFIKFWNDPLPPKRDESASDRDREINLHNNDHQMDLMTRKITSLFISKSPKCAKDILSLRKSFLKQHKGTKWNDKQIEMEFSKKCEDVIGVSSVGQ